MVSSLKTNNKCGMNLDFTVFFSFQQFLLDKVPNGESQAESLQEQQSKLLNFCDDALATSIRMEHAAITQRISNLQAGLETWKGFLERVASLTSTFEDQVNHIENVFKEIHAAVTESDVLPLSRTGMQNRLENLRVSLKDCFPCHVGSWLDILWHCCGVGKFILELSLLFTSQ